MTEPQDSAGRYRTARVEAFSDGVFAIAITLLVLELLVLEIGVPGGSEDDLLGALADQWPSYLAYLVSFSTIGAIWFKHSVITDNLSHSTSILIRLNLLLLLVVSFLPFPTRCWPSTSANPTRPGLPPPSMGSTCFSLRSSCLSCGALRSTTGSYGPTLRTRR
ncbi:MAG TPA: TMEM175 family protein [Nocardioidaceae bacterium]|nr:TMEM175 family protein [Nocardioidaceae bacterium]